MLKGISQNFRLAFGRNVETKTISSQETIAKHLHIVDTPFEKATFGMGCFWGCDSLMGATKGVLRTRVGYAGGVTRNPLYRSMGDHTEVIEIDFDPTEISYKKLLHLFWNNHEYGLTTRVKTQYMSLILFHNEEQQKIAEASREEEIAARKGETIITVIRKADTFYPAEDYHQKYRLQGHKEIAQSIGINKKLLQTSHLAARLNGYLVGVGGLAQFLEEAPALGLTENEIEYVKRYVIEHEGGGLFC